MDTENSSRSAYIGHQIHERETQNIIVMNHTCTKATVRQRAIRNDRISLYLDYYPAVRKSETMQMSRKEYLEFYLISVNFQSHN